MDRNAGRELTTDSVLRDHAKITSHLATWPPGAGTRACRVPTHRDGRRTCTEARAAEPGGGRRGGHSHIVFWGGGGPGRPSRGNSAVTGAWPALGSSFGRGLSAFGLTCQGRTR